MARMTDPPRRLINMIARERADIKGETTGDPTGDGLTLDTVDAINSNGSLSVGGKTLPVIGKAQPNVNDTVAVVWKKTGAVGVLAAGTQKTQFAPTLAVGNPLVEELFIANDSSGNRDVFFRNASGTTALRLSRFISPTFNTVKWGSTNEWFFCNIATNKYAIFHFRRTHDKPIKTGASTLVTLDRVEDLTTKTTTPILAQLSFDGAGNPISQTVTPFPFSGTGFVLTVSSLLLDTAGALIVTYLLSVSDNIAANNLPSTPNPNFRSTVAPFTGQPGINGGALYPIVVDVTNRVVLLNTFTNLTIFNALGWPSFDYNGTPRVDVTYYAGSLIHAVIRPTTWVQANTVLFGTTNVTWWVGYSQTPSAFTLRLEPIFVLDKTVTAAQRVRGLVGYFRGDYTVSVGQTSDDPTDFAFHTPGTMAQQLIFPTAPFDVTPSSAASVRTAYSPVSLFSLSAYPTRPITGLSYAPTLNHLIWRLPSTATFFTSDNGLNVGGSDSPGFVTSFKDGSTVQITSTLRATVGRHGLAFARTDFVYQLDNPVTPLAANAKNNYFVKVWPFRGTATLNIDAKGYPEDARLSQFKKLAAITPGIVQPTGPDQFSLYVNNDQGTLPQAGEFEKFPVGLP